MVHTPHLKEGCVNGVMRNYLIQQLEKDGTRIEEGAYSVTDLFDADELFLSNAMYGIRWVKLFSHKTYSFNQAAQLFQKYIYPLFS